MDERFIVQWLEVLDSLSYYELLSVEPTASYDELRQAFYVFAQTFHPDVHAGRPPHDRERIALIFKRGTEAYRVLSTPALRNLYDDGLPRGELRAQRLSVVPPQQVESIVPPGALRPVERVKKPGARPFVARAEELMKSGDPKQAKLQLVLAMHLDTGNPGLEAFMKEVEAAVLAFDDAERKKWQRGGGTR